MSERERFEAGSGPMLSDEWIEEHWRQAYSQKAFPALTHYTAAVERAVADQLWSGQAASGSSQGARSDRTRSQKLADAGFTRRPSLWALQAREALELIAAPQRADGSWNRDREACRQLAAEALGRDTDSDVQNGVGVGQPEAPTAAPPGSWDEYAMHEAERLWSLPAMPKAQLLACVHCALIDAMKFAAAWRVEVVRVKPLMPPARSGAEAETEAWLIRMPDGRRFVHTHNAIGDYRSLDPGATVVELVPRARSGAGSEEAQPDRAEGA